MYQQMTGKCACNEISHDSIRKIVLIQIFLVITDNQKFHNIFECLNLFLITVSSSELPAIEHHKLLSFQTLCWPPGERSLPIGLLVKF